MNNERNTINAEVMSSTFEEKIINLHDLKMSNTYIRLFGKLLLISMYITLLSFLQFTMMQFCAINPDLLATYTFFTLFTFAKFSIITFLWKKLIEGKHLRLLISEIVYVTLHGLVTAIFFIEDFRNYILSNLLGLIDASTWLIVKITIFSLAFSSILKVLSILIENELIKKLSDKYIKRLTLTVAFTCLVLIFLNLTVFKIKELNLIEPIELGISFLLSLGTSYFYKKFKSIVLSKIKLPSLFNYS